MLKKGLLLILLSVIQSLAFADGASTDIICKSKPNQIPATNKEYIVKMAYSEKQLQLVSVTLNNQLAATEVYQKTTDSTCNQLLINDSNVSPAFNCARKISGSDNIYVILGTLNGMQFDAVGKLISITSTDANFSKMSHDELIESMQELECKIAN